MKAIVFDSGTLISFSMNGMLDLIKKLKDVFKGRFLITNEVKKEIIDKPLTIKRFELEGLRLKQLLNQGVLELPSSIGIKEAELSKKIDEVMKASNNTYVGNKGPINLIARGEAS